MSHLTDEQIDDILMSGCREPEHLTVCAPCREKLAHRRALGERLRRAYSSLQAGDDFRRRVHATLAGHAANAKPVRAKTSRYRATRLLFPVLGAAAAVVLVAVPISLFLTTGNRAQAAQVELVRIHEHNLSDGQDFLQISDFNTLETHFQDKMGYNPATAGIGTHLPLHGCCVNQFRGKAVATYVVRSSEGLVTVLTMTEAPRDLGLHPMPELSQPDYELWGGVCENCNMAARRVGEQTYYAMGRVSHATLADVLSR